MVSIVSLIVIFQCFSEHVILLAMEINDCEVVGIKSVLIKDEFECLIGFENGWIKMIDQSLNIFNDIVCSLLSECF